MAPEGFNFIGSNKRPPQLNQLFSLIIPSKKSKKNKKKFNSSVANSQPFHGKPGLASPSSDDDVVVLDSDNSISNCENSDDDVVVLNAPQEEIVISGSEDEVHKDELHTSEQCDSDVEVLQIKSDVLKVKDNIVINISQPLNIDKIISNGKSNVCNATSSVQIENRIRIETKNRSKFPDIENTLKEQQYPASWTKNMIKYYTEPNERTRNFDYKEILKNLKTQPSDWWINRADRIGTSRSRGFVQCRKCHRTGHIERECTRKKVCFVCGGYNHVFGNCPNTLCFTCGKPARRNLQSCDNCIKYFNTNKSCDLCGQMYHEESLCPSKWRKHLILDNSNQPAKLNSRKFCYNCAAIGHFGFECPLTPDSDYPPENPLRTTFFDETSPQAHGNNNNIMFVSKKTADLLCSENGNQFLKDLSNNMNARIEFFRGIQDYVKIIGEGYEVNFFKIEFRKWIIANS